MSVDPTKGPAISRRDAGLLVSRAAGVFFLLLLLVCRPWDLENGFMIGAPLGRDFANFWLGGHLAITGDLDLLVDLRGYNELLSRIFRHNPEDWLVFSYPPHILSFLVPFGALPYALAVVLWSVLNLFCIERAVRLLRHDWKLAAAACLSPAALAMAAYGHFGGVLAFLTTYILIRGKQRPVLSGCCLALVSVKPQFALVVGLFLILVGYWRVVLFSVPGTLALVAISIFAFGVKPWINFVEWTMPLHAQLIANFPILSMRTTTSLYAGLRMADLPGWAAQAAQLFFGFMVMAKAVLLFRRAGLVEPRTIALALLAIIAALPYSNHYDLAIVAPALTVALFGEGARKPLLPFTAASLLWIAPAFSLSFGLLALPIVPFVVAATVLLALFWEPAEPAWNGAPAGRPCSGI